MILAQDIQSRIWVHLANYLRWHAGRKEDQFTELVAVVNQYPRVRQEQEIVFCYTQRPIKEHILYVVCDAHIYA